MLRTLIVPLDGSAYAERALPYAERVALASGGRLVLVRVGNHAEVTEVTAYLAAVVDRVGIRAPVQTVAAFGEPATEILETVRRFDADQVVMASHGRTGLAHLLYGSIAEAVLAHSPVPVFLVRPHPGGVAAAQFDPRSARIMAPLDGSAFAGAALPVALEVLGTAGELVLLRVVAQDQPLEASNYLQQVANQLRQSNLDLHVTCDVRRSYGRCRPCHRRGTDRSGCRPGGDCHSRPEWTRARAAGQRGWGRASNWHPTGAAGTTRHSARRLISDAGLEHSARRVRPCIETSAVGAPAESGKIDRDNDQQQHHHDDNFGGHDNPSYVSFGACDGMATHTPIAMYSMTTAPKTASMSLVIGVSGPDVDIEATAATSAAT
jgi:nucleotide-binding universal stress UspA family protein